MADIRIYESIKKQLENNEISGLFYGQRYLIEEYFSLQEGRFLSEEGVILHKLIKEVARYYEAQGDKTGIAYYVIYGSALLDGIMAEFAGDKEKVDLFTNWAKKYLRLSLDCEFAVAYCDYGKNLFNGGIFGQDIDEGIKFIEDATFMDLPDELSDDKDFIEYMYQQIKGEYSDFKKKYEEYKKTNTESTQQSKVEKSAISNDSAVKTVTSSEKFFTKGYFVAGAIAFFAYAILSIYVRINFGFKSAFTTTGNMDEAIGVFLPLLLNFSIIPLLMMAYMYKQNNGKHSKLLVITYIALLVGCYVDSFMPFITSGEKLAGENLMFAILYPTIFLVSHRLLSLIIYFIIRGKEGEDDYRIYFAMALLAPIMLAFLLIAVVFWILSGSNSNNSNTSNESSSNRLSGWKLQEEIRKDLTTEGNTTAVYYDNEWRVVDYWNNSSSLRIVSGPDRACFYLQDRNDNIYTIESPYLDKDKIYYFS